MTILLILVLIAFTISAISMLIEYRTSNTAFTRLTAIITQNHDSATLELDEGVVYIIRWRSTDGQMRSMEKNTFQGAVASLILLQSISQPRTVSFRALDKIYER